MEGNSNSNVGYVLKDGILRRVQLKVTFLSSIKIPTKLLTVYILTGSIVKWMSLSRPREKKQRVNNIIRKARKY